jgi:PrtD family type I secretion system ABC transporter
LREFLSGSGVIVFCDAPWVPIFILVLFMLHPVLGLVSVGGAVVLFCLAFISEVTTNRPLREASGISIGAVTFAEAGLRNAEVVAAMAMMPGVLRRWLGRQRQAIMLQSLAADRAGTILALAKSIRLGLQIAIIGTGGWLAVKGQITPGAIVASSIIMARALAPVEMAVSHWKGFIKARTAYGRLKRLLLAVPDPLPRVSLEKPAGLLTIEQLVAGPPGSRTPVLRGIALQLDPGEVLGVIGPSGAGKSTLARVLVGVWPILAGSVRLDGAELDQWNPDELGSYLGYLPQDVELFDGTIAENIARLADEVDSAAVIRAARKAGVHEMILHLPNSYDTRIGPGGQMLSAGQRQRIGLARALYGDPALVVLDEPNSNLDLAGEAALAGALNRLRAEETTVVVITHRPNLLGCVDKILMLSDGRLQAFGLREKVMARHMRPAAIDSSRPGPAGDATAEAGCEAAPGGALQAVSGPSQVSRHTDV